MRTNLFYILKIKQVEWPNDAVLAWLCDPREGHGIPDFAATIVRHLWDREIGESVSSVESYCKIGPGCIPDVQISFEHSLLVVENKVNQGSQREDQLAHQHRLATARQSGKPLYHVLLCADHLRTARFCIDSEAFRILPYSQFAELLETAAIKVTQPDAAMVIRHYLEYARKAYGSNSAAAIREASREKIAARNLDLDQIVSAAEFMRDVEWWADKKGMPELLHQQTILKEMVEGKDAIKHLTVRSEIDGVSRI